MINSWLKYKAGEKVAQSLNHHIDATVSDKIKRISPKRFTSL